MDVPTDAVQSAASARTATHTSGAVPSHQEQSDNEGQDQDFRNAPFACNIRKRNLSRVGSAAKLSPERKHVMLSDSWVNSTLINQSDLVKRHAACHSEGTSKKRKRRSSLSGRTSIACTACAAAKIKCENDKPCLRCLKKGTPCIPVNDEMLAPTSNPDVEGDLPGYVFEQHTPPLSSVRTESVKQSGHDAEESALHHSHVLPQSPNQNSRSGLYSDFDNLGTQIHDNTQHVIEDLPQDGFMAGLPSADFHPDDSFMPEGLHLGDFLADIMMSVSPNQLELGLVGNNTTDILMRDVFDFGIEKDFDLNAIDFQLLSQPLIPGSPTHQLTAADESLCPPSRAEYNNGSGVDPASVEAFQKSLWRWTPGQTDQGHCEQINLSLPYHVGAPSSYPSRPCAEALNQFARDRMLAMVLDTCERDAVPRIVTSFPSAELLDHLMQEYLFFHDQEPDPFIHVPTFQPQSMRAELVASIVFFGAVRSPVPLVRKLGFALQESVRLALPKAFERDNSMTRDLQVLQANILELKLGLWSGNRRKMEIAESHGLPLITMLRRSGRFKRRRQRPAAPTPEDPPDVLDSKWREWVEAESFKRLVFFVAVYDAHLSMSFHVPPLMKYGEMSLDLPASIALWKAKTAAAWRDEYLTHGLPDICQAPAVIACVHTAHDMLEAQDRIDLEFSVNIALSMFWKVIWDARQLQAATRPYAGRSVTASLTSGHWQHELSQTLRNFCMIVGEAQALSPGANLLHEYLHLNIYVSFDELSLFAGKEGHREARRVYASLKQWADSRDARQALWHAGQVVREATTFAPGTLFGFYAVALYHAGLTLWAYGLLTNGVRRMHGQSVGPGSSSNHQIPSVDPNGVVFLDGIESGDTQKFVALNRATPVIHRRDTASGNAISDTVVYLDDPQVVMATITSILRDHFHNLKILPTLVENLIHLMDDLGKVATTRTTTKS
ncbi:hypothetical protein D6C86_02421 [Aureobasidium pullulans]|uniref:Zn(2)-C6 fungal-type domain-containing protein n=1 Tax=Aureobasidium pullulans TaxID=5580 RepID=A0A4S9YA96_AURPU|nr:hypothetical protein D6C94_09471 [Aureobasidium pullulans]THZ43133.1 hypothetical protein D6C87_04523 [Aureobasidium pullulans]THZ64782.1 hypothetical protein D6C86_02421 [Aureobasidium pullulans]THZ88957.1 hypothetical protein D6C88_04885 [Aureobasidium pullulans]